MNKPSKAAADEFRDYCLELFDTLSPHAGIAGIAAKRMFGGTGFSMDGKTFAIIAFDQLWLKVDDETRAAFDAAKSAIFTYESAGKTRTMSYYTVPPDAMESAQLMRPWAERAWGAALRAAATKIAKPKKPKKITE
jgi:DNA transformation protein and related proteins